MYIMKKLLTSFSPKILFLVLLMSFSFSKAHGIIWNNLDSKVDKKLKRKAGKKVEQNIDESIDKSFDKTESKTEKLINFGDKSSDNQDITKDLDMSKMLSGKADIKDEYKFDLGITFKSSSTNAKGKVQELGKMTLWTAESGITAFHATENHSTLIVDPENETRVIIQDKDKTYMTMKSNMKLISEKIIDKPVEKAEVSNDMKFEKIGSEDLLGYTCDIYKITGGGKETNVWITKDIKFNYGNMAGDFSHTLGRKQKFTLPDMRELPQEVMLKVISSDSQTKESMSMEATEVFIDGTTIKMSSYKEK